MIQKSPKNNKSLLRKRKKFMPSMKKERKKKISHELKIYKKKVSPPYLKKKGFKNQVTINKKNCPLIQ